MLSKIENPELQVGVAALGIDGHSFCKQGFNLLRGLPILFRFLALPNGHRVKVVGESISGLLTRKPRQLGSTQVNGMGAACSILPRKI